MARTDPPRVLMDACAFIAIIKDEPDSRRLDGLLDMLDRGDAQLVESVQILGEVYKKSTATHLARRLLEDGKLDNIRARLLSRDVELLDVTLPITRRATEYRQTYRLKLPDAVHLATAVLNKCDWFVTFDGKFPDIEGMRTFRLEHLQDRSFSLPWEAPVQGELFPLTSNVVPMRPPGSSDAEVAGS
jgi:predicted nucleic acid-binding protein